MRILRSRTFIGALAVIALLCLAAAFSVRSIVSATAARPGSGRQAADSLPAVTLPPELDRVLRDYERHWAAGDEAALAALFTQDAMLMPSGFPAVQGREAIRHAYKDVAVPVRLRALAFAAEDSTGYIVASHTYEHMDREMGKLMLALRRPAGGAWMIAAEVENVSFVMPPGGESASPALPR